MTSISISIIKSRESIFSGIYFSTHLNKILINGILIISLLPLDVTLLFTFVMLQQIECHSFSAYHGGDTVDENQEQSHKRDS